jgi:hypothetical protein
VQAKKFFKKCEFIIHKLFSSFVIIIVCSTKRSGNIKEEKDIY